MRRGGRNAFVYVFFGLLTFTSACNTDAKEEHLTTEETIIAKTIEQAESVESYAIEGGLLEDFLWEDGSSEYNYLLLSSIEIPERTYSQVVQEYGIGEFETTVFTSELYQNAKERYINLDDKGWKKSDDPKDIEYDYTGYEAPIMFLKQLENVDELTVEETENEYEIRYSEPDASLYDIYGPPSDAVKNGTVFVETGSPEVFLVIDKADYTVREFTTTFFYEDEAGSDSEGTATMEMRFDDINEVEDFEIPDEVIEEAEANE
ncbi:hypothetical protein J1TS1_39350 [Shouchella clausii]|uniref:DUF6612 family protein n=1 Tax=Shouchella clausii TaxID=79880 RepID=UPI001B0A09E4|nr:DUF6612 family protein [Shouchella clausii]GIN09790.1 hypothetical protein J1TS1_39350 [Shouchella clausii]